MDKGLSFTTMRSTFRGKDEFPFGQVKAIHESELKGDIWSRERFEQHYCKNDKSAGCA